MSARGGSGLTCLGGRAHLAPRMALPSKIYLDHGGTTPLDPVVLEGLTTRLAWPLGNPNAAHESGQVARAMLEDARRSLASALGCTPESIVFTSGGTESLTLAVRGATTARRGRVLITTIEHSAVRTAAEALKTEAEFELDLLGVGSTGLIDPATLREALHPETRVVALILAQNEIGTIQPLERLVPLIRAHAPRARIVVDAVQAFGKADLHFLTSGPSAVDALAITAHKLHGPVGIGALFVNRPLHAWAKGGGQERGMRGGTQPAVLAWAFAEAVRQYALDVDAAVRIGALRDHLVASILESLPGVRLTGEPSGPSRLYNNAHFCIAGLPSEPLVNGLSSVGVAASAGAACSTGKGKVSPTLQAIGRRETEGAFLRMTLGRTSTLQDVDDAALRLVEVVTRLRQTYSKRTS
ncbi:MAG: aminotransferase class V-fold PLP-dependent enzyme [Myxococcales bacterium]|nr:aminotransferase class V-fold PLP-dependent enzyme [Myxococcales bacterium]